MKKDKCSVEICNNKKTTRSICAAHYSRLKRTGSLDESRPIRTPERHPMYQKPVYKSWHMMLQRCYNKNYSNYSYYGGRGIKVCDEWRDSFVSFFNDMGDRPEGTSLDRIDVNGDYTKDNCRWANRLTQVMNQRVRFDSTSGYRGVSFDKYHKKWEAYISINKKRKHLGYFKTIEEAAKARKDYVYTTERN